MGTPATPTPPGKFFIEEAVALAPGHAGGPFALATSARSNVLQEFEGGPGQIALHGTPGSRGRRAARRRMAVFASARGPSPGLRVASARAFLWSFLANSGHRGGGSNRRAITFDHDST